MVTNEKLKRDIVNIIEAKNGGVKGVDLVLSVMQYISPAMFPDALFWEVMRELIKDGDLVELEYSVPPHDKIKSMFFPRGTKIKR